MIMAPVLLSFALASAFVCFGALPIAAQSQDQSPKHLTNLESDEESLYSYPGWKVRYGIAPDTDLKALADRTEALGALVNSCSVPETGRRGLRGYGEAQGLYEVPMDAVVASLRDTVGQTKIYPRLLEARVEAEEGLHSMVYQRVGISLFGIKVGYRMRIEVYCDELPDGSVGIRTRLLDCLDGNMFESFSSWYVAEVDVEGRKMTYLRLYSSPGIADPFPGTAMIVRGLIPWELRDSIAITLRDARRRASEQGQ